jgi:2-methylcitrate dehydratase PrpD
VLSYVAQSASGIRTMERDAEHVLKSFVFGGMTAHNGVAAAAMVAAGFTGVEDEFTGERNRNFFSAFCPNPEPHHMVDALGSRFEILGATLKRWSVGAPVQAAVDATLTLMSGHGIGARDVEALTITTPDNEAPIVSNSHMCDVNIQHLVAVTLLDGGLDFAAAHDAKRMRDRKVLALKARMKLIPCAELTVARPARQCIIAIRTRDGRELRHHTIAVTGSPERPMSRQEVADKALDLMGPVLGKKRSAAVVECVWNLERIRDMRTLSRMLRA